MTYEVLGHLIRLQARGALADFAAADRHAAAVDRLAERHELPLASVFTQWYRALRLAASGQPAGAETAYRDAAARLDGAGMPGLERGLLPLALLCLRVQRRRTWSSTDSGKGEGVPVHEVPGPGPLRSTRGRTRPAPSLGHALRLAGVRTPGRGPAALRALPEPPRDLMYEVCCCLESVVALEVGDRDVLERPAPACCRPPGLPARAAV